MSNHATQPKAAAQRARLVQLVTRSAFDLKLAHDAALAAALPFAGLVKLKRAQREVGDLARELALAAASANV